MVVAPVDQGDLEAPVVAQALDDLQPGESRANHDEPMGAGLGVHQPRRSIHAAKASMNILKNPRVDSSTSSPASLKCFAAPPT